MKKSILSFLTATLVFSTVYSQNSSLNIEEEGGVGVLNGATGILIIPFKHELYKSDIDKEINEKTGLSHESIKQKMRIELTLQIYDKLKEKAGKKNVNILADWNDETIHDLRYVYESTALHYDYLEKTLEQPESYGVARVLRKAKKMIIKDENANEETPGTRIEEGQVITVYENKPKYMSTKISNPNMPKLLSSRYHANKFLFLNQLDLLKLPGSEAMIPKNKRIAKVHYTWIDERGSVIEGGIAQAYFSEFSNSPERISETCFKHLAEQISGLELSKDSIIDKPDEEGSLLEYENPMDHKEKTPSDTMKQSQPESIKTNVTEEGDNYSKEHSKPFIKKSKAISEEKVEDIMDDY